MLNTRRKPASVAEVLVEEFMAPMGLTQVALAKAMGVQRKHVNELCNGGGVPPRDRAHPRPSLRQ
jgi:addiction module HigA family antidote